jgi:nucleotide-binding universal stress UspA family protein
MPPESAEGRIEPSRRLRRSYESGHHPKFLVLVDDSEECGKAVYYAGRRAARVGAEVVLLRVIPAFWDEVPLLGVADVMRAEAQQEARQMLHRFEVLAHSVSGESPESVIREGDPARAIFESIQTDEDIAMLVLAAGTSTTSVRRLMKAQPSHF